MKKIITSILCISVLSATGFAGMQSGFMKNPEPKRCFISTPSVELFPKSFSTHSALFSKGRGSDAFAEGVMSITAGYGYPNLWKAIFKLYEDELDYAATGMGPIHFKFEYGLADKIGMGVSVNYVSAGATWRESYTDIYGVTTIYDYEWTTASLSVLARMNIHFATSDKLDPFWGVGVGYKNRTYDFTTNDPLSDWSATAFTPFGLETTLGLRYYFSDALGIYMEMGMAKSVIQGGLALKF